MKRIHITTIQTLTLALGLIFFTACGGGGGSGGFPSSLAPIEIEDVGEGKSCLIGKWRMDNEDYVLLQKDYLASQPASEGIEDVSVDGEAFLTFLDDGITAQMDVIGLSTTYTASVDTVSFTTKVTLTGTTDWEYTTDEDEAQIDMATTDILYTVETELSLDPGNVLTETINSDDGIFGSVLGFYNCTGDKLVIQSFMPQNNIPRIWYREL